MGALENKKILLGVTGGIAAYKAVELLRLLQKAGAEVRVVMTKNATAFVGPLTFRAISGHAVYLDVLEEDPEGGIRHIAWADWADAVVIAPATANCVAKLAHGFADDALSTLMLAVRAPVLICPAMNTHMYESRPVQRNLDLLEASGMTVLEPDSGDLACGVTGPGRLPDPAFIADRLVKLLVPKDLKGVRILMTAGPTQEAIDPVRYISNHSSGKMGYAIARAAEYRGADVALVTGPVSLPFPVGVERISVKSAREMLAVMENRMERADIIIKVAAVADFCVQNAADHKIKKTEGAPVIVLEKNPDILATLGAKKSHQFLVGFAAETRDLAAYAKDKIARKNLDMIVGNLVSGPDSAFGSDLNTVTFFYPDGSEEALEALPKERVADLLLDAICARRRCRGGLDA
ncbi:bifunctional phosphopantothenoylcysteine decarboxylase/phosphopantothenate--cysteine ligase CoaBC [Desulfobotulus sp.]|jgi:phosphopantothenoylcysteine decarboxylase/phosphopantothenate--cysteine ligase|uniref:bifunctional phosphopantothenoylcysteine decarboxylase/phosphopantothenate--cysteine ligase CoaBC n=1 Tax=Desulfobotulus sp. TaxID=1940337 RepID=UPI002A36BDEA|nr:bifunctional phosphopantothenoylcysteine decarboxylase/phosphopantothenate--cysteine ligase CoaBC [Desulfobotulus sp.]MDY0163345.1 bifunctional phosphopantothenoylcysteine decarboxylase/phosphopantothenate--cysteine ligase CoaBC [Desulfobotulus sp.]